MASKRAKPITQAAPDPMACCCKAGQPDKTAVSCLGRCDLPKHKCVDKKDVRPGPVPKNMGWLYTAKDAPKHQLKCGWRPGHISCDVLRTIEQHNCIKYGRCLSCARNCCKPCCSPPTTCCETPEPPCGCGFLD